MPYFDALTALAFCLFSFALGVQVGLLVNEARRESVEQRLVDL